MSKIDYENLGPATVKRTTKKAALLAFDESDYDEEWVPFSVMSVSTAAQCDEGQRIQNVRLEDWFVDCMG